MGYHFREQESFVRIVELTPALRKRIEATIEDLVSLLDQYDGDENIEEDDPSEEGGDLEPSLGWTDLQARLELYGVGDMPSWPFDHDLELDTSYDEDGGDDEPTLGAPERHPDRSQEHWADGLRGDHGREEENEHGGDILDEPHDDGEDAEEDFRGCELA